MCQESGLIGFAKFAQLSNPSQYDIYHDGGVAEYIRVPYWQLDLLPDSVSFEAAAKAHDAGVALQALKLADLPPHSTVVVTAPTGAMGVITVRLAKQFAISKLILIGRSPERLEKVKTISTVPTEIVSLIDPDIDIVDSVRKFAPQGVQAIIDYIPVGDTVSKLLPVMVTGGTLVHFGGNPTPLKVPMGAMMANCWRLISSRGNARVDTNQALKLLADGELKIDDLFTHKYPFSDAEKAVDTIENRREPMWLSIIHVS
ncbi:hypothetical protein BGW36DRAFT_373861 [Talaromyces proteolyticus]|uniref:Alcohol dehydrogenase-like C-terminal domain-containing protein n=1 Tax=Talaromyces proteolyticus TaxID=1131652 RepID=A0AAD4KYD0_9EURO|nr:uncharacterized protein BGW36DRAFT_373861 [Talaromyces proteolyticus]KAH8700316.1 hypothetical protein BGW36DRAFT_373861 [Talaromyces proteolyticus]